MNEWAATCSATARTESFSLCLPLENWRRASARGQGTLGTRFRLLRALLLALSCSVFVLAGPHAARADEEPLAACVDRLDDVRVSQLLRFVEGSVREQRLGAALWYGGWSAFNVGNVTAGAIKLATQEDRIQRDVWLMTTIGASGFLVGAALFPLPGLYAHRKLAQVSPHSPAQRREQLRRALSLLEDAAAGEDRNSNLLTHFGGIFYGLLSAGYIVLHNLHGDTRDVWFAAGLQLGSTVLGAQATLWTVPRRARRDLAYARGHFCPAPGSRRAQRAERPNFAASLTGLQLRF